MTKGYFFLSALEIQSMVQTFKCVVNVGNDSRTHGVCNLFAFGLEADFFHFWDKPLNHIVVKKHGVVRRGTARQQ